MPNHANPIITAENLTIGYTKPVAQDIHFTLHMHEVLHVKGANGSGKSTLIKTLLGDLTPLKGSIHTHALPTEVSYLPQLTQSYAHISLTVREMLQVYDVNPTLTEFFSSELLTTRWIDLSGGQKQKTLLLTRVKPQTRLLILDEPFNHIDSSSISDLEETLATLVTQKVVGALLLVSHIDLPKLTQKARELQL